MDRTTKTILIITGAVVLACGCLAAAALATGLWTFNQLAIFSRESFSEDPGVAVRVGDEIADFEVPGGYGSPHSIHFGDVTVIDYSSPSGMSHIFLAQFPEGTSINVEELLKIIEEGSSKPDSFWYNTELALVQQKSVEIREQASTLNISEGTSKEGIPYRAATAEFQGRGGPAMVLIAGPLSEWDEEAVEQFIASIR